MDTENKDHVVLTIDWDNGNRLLVDGPMTENAAFDKVTELIMGPGMVTFVEPTSAIDMPEPGSNIVHFK